MSNALPSQTAKPATIPHPEPLTTPPADRDFLNRPFSILRHLHKIMPRIGDRRAALRDLAQALADEWPADVAGAWEAPDGDFFLYLRNASPPAAIRTDSFQLFMEDQVRSIGGYALNRRPRLAEKSSWPAPANAGREIKSMISAPLFQGEEVMGLIAVGSAPENAFREGDKALLRSIADIFTSLWTMRDQMFALAQRDELTGLHTRNYVMEHIRRHLQLSARHHYPVALLMVDVDDFKAVNDRRGHLAGDDTLKFVASVLASSARSSDIVGRFGGDEFLLFLPHTTAEGALALARRLKSAMENQTSQQGNGASVITISIGIAATDLNGATMGPDELLNYADHALLKAKNRGRNECWVWQAGANLFAPEAIITD